MLAFEEAPWRAPREGVMRVRSSDGVTLVFNDLLFNPSRTGFQGAVLRALGQGPQLSWLAKQMFVDDSASLGMWLDRLSRTRELRRLIPAHIEPVREAAAAVLARVASRA